MSTAIYPGSFDPFTLGHLDIVEKAWRLFDRVIILVSDNNQKQRTFSLGDMVIAIGEATSHLAGCKVSIYNGLVAQYAKEIGTPYIIRGIRNNIDYNYEESIAEINKLLNPNIQHIYFRADHANISSSMVRELMNYGQDVSPYLPEAVANAIQGVKI